ncbi:MAG: LptF/LptG family permease [Verrucomicrobiota bacterium]|nr:LptF/LptG family permease [Verrucomicrobiota bacterium]
MRTLHGYLLRQVLLALLMTVAVFTVLLLLGSVLKEILALVVTGQVSFIVVVKAIGLLIPYVMTFVLPFGMLTASLLVFGRFSADNELTAVRASGVSLISLVTPVLLLGLALCALTALINLKVAPAFRTAYKNLVFNAGMLNPTSLITEERFIDEIPGFVLYLRKRNGDIIEDVRMYLLQEGTISQRISAESGRILWDETNKTIAFELNETIVEALRAREEYITNEISLPSTEVITNLIQATDGTNFISLTTNSVEYVVTTNHVMEWHNLSSGAMVTDPVDLKPLLGSTRRAKLTEMTHSQLKEEIARRLAQGINATPAEVAYHRQIAFSFASFAFTLVGIPLAIRAHRRETSIGVAISLLLVLLYYGFFILAEGLQTRPSFFPQYLLWVPNFLFQAVGSILLFRANRAG